LTPRTALTAPPAPQSPPAQEPSATTAAREAAEAALVRGRLCFEAVDFTCAEHELGLARAGPLSASAKVEALRLLAEIHLGREDRASARELCLDILLLDPAFAPTVWPEPWRAVLAEARRLAPDRAPPEVVPSWPANAARGAALEISAQVTDPSGVGRCELVVLPDGPRLRMRTDDGERWSTMLPVELVDAGVSLTIEAWDKLGNGPARAPDTGAFALTLAPPTAANAPIGPGDTPITSRWWFWTGLVVVAVGAGLGLGFAFAGDGKAASSALGDVNVVPQFPGQR
jgi:hypothetical protein